jgi:hypothetical protein
MIGDAKSDAYGSVCGLEAKEIRVLFKIESNVIVLSFCERGYMSGDVISGTDEAVQTELGARLGIVTLGH